MLTSILFTIKMRLDLLKRRGFMKKVETAVIYIEGLRICFITNKISACPSNVGTLLLNLAEKTQNIFEFAGFLLNDDRFEIGSIDIPDYIYVVRKITNPNLRASISIIVKRYGEKTRRLTL